MADVVEAMASHRPYRPALGVEAALDEIEKHRGRLYDAQVADACLTLFRERRFAFRRANEESRRCPAAGVPPPRAAARGNATGERVASMQYDCRV